MLTKWSFWFIFAFSFPWVIWAPHGPAQLLSAFSATSPFALWAVGIFNN